MALFNIFKKKQKPEKEIKAEKSKEEPQKIVEGVVKKSKERKFLGLASRVLKSPHITEKATDLTKNNQYIFNVLPSANKIEIKKVIIEEK